MRFWEVAVGYMVLTVRELLDTFSLGHERKSLRTIGIDHNRFEQWFVTGPFFLPIENKIGARTPFLIDTVDNDLYGFQGFYENSMVEIGADRLPMGVVIHRFIDKDLFVAVRVVQAYGNGQVGLLLIVTHVN